MPHQHPLFPENVTVAIEGSSGIALTALKIKDARLTPAQKRFNQLLKQTQTLADGIEALRNMADQQRLLRIQKHSPLEQQHNDLLRQMVRWLDARLKRKGLTKRQTEKAHELLCDMAGSLAMDGDVEMQAIHDAHAEHTLDEQTQFHVNDFQQFMEGVLGEKVGDDDAFDTLEDVMEASVKKMAAQRDAQAKAHAESQAKAAAKPKKQTAAQQKAQSQQQDASTALRTIYRQLASALHPDRETDPQEQQRKTALMKEANAAYERRDLLALLHLQMQAELVDVSQVATLAKEKLAALTSLLKERVAVLRDEMFTLERHIGEEFDYPPYEALSASALQRHVQATLQGMQADIRCMKHDLEAVQDDKFFKRWLNQQHAARFDFDADFCPF